MTRLILLPLLLPLFTPAVAESLPAAPAGAPPPIPIEKLFRAPYLSRVRLSPDGRCLAGLNHTPEGPANLALVTVDRPTASIIKGSDNIGPYGFLWLDDKSLVVQSVRDKIYAGGLHRINCDDLGHVVPLAPDSVKIIGHPVARPKILILWQDMRAYNGPYNESIVGERHVDDSQLTADHSAVLGRQPLRKARHSVRYPEPKPGIVLGYEADVAGELALSYLYDEGRIRAFLYNADKKAWAPLEFDAEATAILAVEADHRHLWLSEYSAAAGFEVRRWSVETGERGPAAITDPLFNPAEGSIHYSHRENALAGITYRQRRLKSVWLHPRYAGLQARVDRLLPQTDNQLVDTDAQERFFLYFCQADQVPGTYYLLDSEQGKLTPFAQVHPWLEGTQFQPTRTVKFKARDGLELEGYLTIPAGASARHKVPLVVLCHGGPATRDIWGFDPEVQFLASRGYAVLQPNYRGSSGYKPAISKEWEYDYRRMHDDVTDAARTFRQLDLVDRQRIAIMGASFGGYLAVSGAAFEGTLYRCAVTNSGVFDWERLVKTAKRDGRPGEYEMLRAHVGQPGRDRQTFDRISPMAAIDDIKIPIFVAHGRDDNVVDLGQSTKLASRLRFRDVPVETFFPDEELHGFRSPKNTFEYYRRIEAFLAKYLR